MSPRNIMDVNDRPDETWAGDIVLENVLFLLDTGLSPSLICHRLGRTGPAIARLLDRRGRPELAAQFYAADRPSRAGAGSGL